ncbi:hypothetical protein ACROYT_G017095 [Oculina patagonica]
MFRFGKIISVLIVLSVPLEAKITQSENQLFDAKEDTSGHSSLDKRSTGYTHGARSIWGCSCFLPLGMESGYLPNSALSASSSWDANHTPELSRLNKINPKVLVVDAAVVVVFCVGTVNSTVPVVFSAIAVFGGNADRNTPVYNFLYPNIQATYVRFHPRTWHGHISMRAEVYGCNVHHCLMSLGMEDGRIKDTALSASTIYNANHAAKLGRVNLVPPKGYSGAWCAKTLDANQWIQIDLGRPTTVTKVATQGRQDCCNQWVTSYAVSYSLISPYWVYHMNHGQKKVFPGNYDPHSIVVHDLVPSIHARLVKIHPLSYNSHISMRVELYGCPIKGI